MSRVLTCRTGRYGELRWVRKYEGESPGRVGVDTPYDADGDACADPYVGTGFDASPRMGTGLGKRFDVGPGAESGVTGYDHAAVVVG